MTMKNKEFLAALNNTPALRAAKPSDRDRALEAILLADERSQTAFEKAAVDHVAFWGTIDNTHLANLKARPQYSYSYDYLDLNPKTSDTFASMKQAAAEQRVKFALSGAAPDVLVGLLTTDFKDNGTILRQYVKSKETSLGLDGVLLNGVPWDPNDDKLLTQTALDKIRKEAANQLLLKVMANPGITDPKLFDDLAKAATPGDYHSAAKALATAAGMTAAPGKSLDETLTAFTDALVLSQDIIDAATKHREAIFDAPAIVGFERQLQKFKSSATDAEVLGMKTLLKEADQKTFTTDLAAHANLKEDPQNPYKARMAGLPEDKKKALATTHQQPLCEQYLKAKILSTNKLINDKHLIKALNDANKSKLITHLEKFTGADADDKAIIGKAVTDTNMATFKVALTKNAIKAIGAGGTPAHLTSLKELETAANKDLASFRKELAKKIPGVASFDFVQEKDLPELRKALGAQIGAFARNDRAAQFEAEVKKSRLDAGKPAATHKELVAVFKQLPDAKQLEILKDIDKTKKHELLISAKTKEELQYYLGTKNAEGGPLQLTRLVEENARAALFKQIHNPTVAKVLMGFEPSITPTPTMIDDINTALKSAAAPAAVDISQQANLKTVVDAISQACYSRQNDLSDAEFYKAFGFTDQSATTLGVSPIPAAAQAQHAVNVPLFAGLHGATLDAAEKEFVKVLLRVGEAIPGLPLSNDVDIRNAHKILRNNANVHNFLTELLKDPGVSDQLKEKVSREFTPDVYRELKGARLAQRFSGTDQNKLNVIGYVGKNLTDIQEKSPAVEKHKSHLEKLEEELEALPGLFSGANEPKAKNKAQKMIGEYRALSEQCGTIIEHLAKTKENLKVFRDNTPVSGAGANQEVIQKLAKLHERLDKEIKTIDEQLEFYKGVKTKIDGKDGAIANIEKVMQGKATVQVEKATVSYSVIPIGQEKTATLQSKAGENVGTTTAITNIDQSSPNYKIHEIPTKGNVFSADLVHKKDNPQRGRPGQPDEIDDPNGQARVTVNYHPEGQPSTSGSKPISVSLPIVAKDKNYLAEQCMEAAKQLLKDWDGKSPIRLRGVNGKEKELAYLWTAVCVLGEHHPKFSMDKIEFRGSCAWRPDQGKDKELGGIRGKSFTKTSLYNTVFKGTARGLVEEVEREFKAMVDPKKRDQVDKTVVSATSLFRDKMSQGRPSDIASIVELDKGKQVPRAPSLGLSSGDED